MGEQVRPILVGGQRGAPLQRLEQLTLLRIAGTDADVGHGPPMQPAMRTINA